MREEVVQKQEDSQIKQEMAEKGIFQKWEKIKEKEKALEKKEKELEEQKNKLKEREETRERTEEERTKIVGGKKGSR